MEKITKVWCGPLPPDSPYMKPLSVFYVRGGNEKRWDLLKVHDSVSIIIFNTTRKKLVFVKQFRPAVYYGIVTGNGGTMENLDLTTFPISLGVTLELCAGIIDKNKSWADIAREEVLEECGYDISVDRLEEVLKYRSGVGTTDAQQIMYYCEVTDQDHKEEGGGVEDEMIDVVEYSLQEAEELVKQGSNVNSPPSFLFGVLWFLTNKATKPKEENMGPC